MHTLDMYAQEVGGLSFMPKALQGLRLLRLARFAKLLGHGRVSEGQCGSKSD